MINVQEAKLALIDKSIKVTSLERIKIMHSLKDKYASLPQQLRFGHVLKDFLSQVSIPLKEYDLIVGRYVEKEPTEEEEAFCNDFFSSDNLYKTTVLSCGHATLEWEYILNEGLSSLRDKTELHAKTATGDKKDFLLGAVLVLEGIINFIQRYAQACENANLFTNAKVLRAIASSKPKTFYEALQLCWIITFIDCAYITPNPTLTLGRMDQFLYPYYKNDVENGLLTKEEAIALITDYYCKHNLIMGTGEHQLGDSSNSTGFDRILNFDSPLYLLLAGTDENGNDAVNELTYLFAQCIQPSFKNPLIVVRYYKNLNTKHPKLWNTLCAKALASSSMMFYNDNDIISAFQKQGVEEKDARNYGHFGCNWADLGGNSLTTYMGPTAYTIEKLTNKSTLPKSEKYGIGLYRYSTPYGYPEQFMEIYRQILQDGGAKNIDEFYTRFKIAFKTFLQNKLEKGILDIEQRKNQEAKILTLGDCLGKECIEKACMGCAGGKKYHVSVNGFVGFATVADCFCVVDKLVYQDKSVTAEQLYEATINDFNGYDEILKKIESVEKFGSGNDFANEHAKRLALLIGETVSEVNIQRKDSSVIIMPSLQSDNWHIQHGTKYGATVDGRRAFQPFSQNSNPAPSRSKNGRISMLSSLSTLPFDYFTSGALNFDVQPEHFKGKEGMQNFANVISTYLNNGGLHLQINAVSRDDLVKAQLSPENYADLRVRVTGYTGIFTSFPKNLQDDIINRMN